MKENLLVTLADKNYIDQAKQLFSSVYWNAGWKGDYMLLAHEIPEKDLKWFRDKGILIKKCKPLYNKPIGEGYRPVVLDKFYLFTPEFRKWKHVIYLDADIIVRASLDELTKVNRFAASDSIFQLRKQFFNRTKNEKLFFEEINLGYNINKLSFNTGVLAFPTNIIQENSFNELKKIFKRYKSICRIGEEPIFNLFFYRKRKKIPWVYNTDMLRIIYDCNIKPEKIKGVTLHFISCPSITNKPWEKNNPFYPEWKSNLERAELIDLNNRIPPKKRWREVTAEYYTLYLKSREKIVFIIKLTHSKIKKTFYFLINTPDRIIGQIGILIKKHNPNLYYKLKGVKK